MSSWSSVLAGNKNDIIFKLVSTVNLWFQAHSNITYFDQQTHACACVPMVKRDQKHLKIMKNNQKHKIPNEQPAFGCQPAFRSHSQSLTNKLFSSFFLMSITWASSVHNEKGTFSWFLNANMSLSLQPIHLYCWSSWCSLQ